MAWYKEIGECCGCIPLQIGVLIISVYTFIHGCVCIAAMFTGDLRLQPGGYFPWTQGLQIRFGALGIPFGILGLVGVMDTNFVWIRAYNKFQYAKVTLSVIVFIADLWALRGCDDAWTSASAADSPVFNAAVDTLSVKHICKWTREAYIIGFALDLALNGYFAYVGKEYEERIEHIPPILLQFKSQEGKTGAEDHSRIRFYNPEIGELASYTNPSAAELHEETRRREQLLKT